MGGGGDDGRGVEDDGQTSVWFRDRDTEEERGDAARGGRDEDIEVL